MTATPEGVPLPPEVERQLTGLPAPAVALGLLTYNNAATAGRVADVAQAALARHFAGWPAVLINADAGSTDATPETLSGVGLPIIRATHEVPAPQRTAVPFHGVPGRSAALRLAFGVAHRLGARAFALLEADVTSVTEEWVERLLRPVVEQKADFVLAAHARARQDGAITSLLLAPMVRALFGRRLHQPLAGAWALSARLLDRLLGDPRWPAPGRHTTDFWIEGTAIAEGFTVWEAWLGARRVESGTRTADLPTLLVQALGALFDVMDQYEDLWVELRPSEPVPVTGAPVALPDAAADTERMIGAFRRGLRDLGALWELILAPETFGDVLSVEATEDSRFRFPDDVWVRVVYDFALGHRYGVVYREHLLRSLVPLFLGRAAAFLLETRGREAAATDAALEAVGAAFERQKRYLVDRWR